MKRNFNSSSISFKNFRNLFTFRGFAILLATIALSFSVRSLVILFFKLDLSQFSDFLFVGILVSFIRVFITDLFEFYLAKDNLTSHGLSQDSNSYSTPVASHPQEGIKDKTKRKVYWFIWKQYTDKFSNYRSFKEAWDVKTKLRDDIKKDLKDSSDIKKLKKIKRTILWFWNPKE